jgi:hypothetical protein
MNSSRRLPGLAAALLLTASSAVACGHANGPSSAAKQSHDPEREWRVAGDKNATADEIIDAGQPADVAASGDQTLITWLANPEDDEGPSQGAWRLYDADGVRVADGKLGIVREASARAVVLGVDDGFLIQNYTSPELLHVATSGTLSTVPFRKKARPTQAGDVLLAGQGDTGAYRPSEHTAYRLPHMPSDQWQSVQLDDDGKVWVMLPWDTDGDARIAEAQGGVAPWHTEVVDLPAGSAPTIDMAYAGGELMFPQQSTEVDDDGEGDEYQAVWRRATSSEAGPTAWHSTALNSALLPKTYGLGLAKTVEGRLLVIGEGTALLEQADGSLQALKVPGKSGTYVDPVGDALYAYAWKTAELYVSEDLGESWTVVDR